MAIEVIPISKPIYVTIPLVEPYTVLNLGVPALATLEPSVDDVSDHAVARDPPGRPIGGRGRPPPRDDVVARRLRRLWGHPEPESGLEGDHRVSGHKVRVVQ